MSYTEGDNVLARLPGSRSYLPGKVTSVGRDEHSIRFDSGDEYVIPTSNIKSVVSKSGRSKSPTRPKSPARPKSPSRVKSPARPKSPTGPKSPARPKSPTGPKSPARSKSPARPKSPGRTKSPSRKKSPTRTKSPARNKSPTRKTKDSPPPSPSRKKTVNRKSQKNLLENEEIESESLLDKVRSRTRRITEEKEIIKTIQSTVSDALNGIPDFKSAITRRTPRKEHVYHFQDASNYVSKTITSDLSDNEDIISNYVRNKSVEKASVARELSEPKTTLTVHKDFGGTIGVFFLSLAVTFFPIFVNLFCVHQSCNFVEKPRINTFVRNFSYYFDPKAFYIYFGYVFLQYFISVLPFGGRNVDGILTKNGKLKYRTNGLFAIFVIFTVIFALEYFKIPIVNMIYEKYMQILIAAAVYGFLEGIACYIHSFYQPISLLNPYGNTDSKFYNFFMGREINPRFFKRLDIKVNKFRIGIIGVIIMNTVFILKSLNLNLGVLGKESILTNLNYHPTLLVLCATQIIYSLDAFVFEAEFLSSFEFTTEGVGYMLTIGYAVYPWLPLITVKYVYEHNVNLPIWVLVLSTLMFLIGFTIYRGSNLQKNEFRRNPFSPSVARLESIPTQQGKKLLVSGYWGIVRHPNYLGDILLTLSWAVFTPLQVPVLYPLFIVWLLCHRATRDNTRCKAKYGAAWDRYCERVKYKVIPHVF